MALALLGVSGCATITRGTKDAFVVETDPAGAQVSTSNGHSCESTPCTIKMPRRSEFAATITKEGYETWTGQVTNKVSGGGGLGMAGNVVFGGLIGAGVDVGTGAMLDLTPNPLVVKLERPGAVPAALPSSVAIQAPAAPPLAAVVAPVSSAPVQAQPQPQPLGYAAAQDQAPPLGSIVSPASQSGIVLTR